MSCEEQVLLNKQVAEWVKERNRLDELIAAATGQPSLWALLNMAEKAIKESYDIQNKPWDDNGQMQHTLDALFMRHVLGIDVNIN